MDIHIEKQLACADKLADLPGSSLVAGNQQAAKQIVFQSAVKDSGKKTEPGDEEYLKTFPVLSRYQRWKQEQTFLIDTSRYIQPVSAQSYFQPEVRIRDLYLSGIKREYVQNDWILFVFLFALTVFASIRTTYEKYLNHLFRSVFYYPAAVKMFAEKNYPIVHGAFRLEFYFYIIAASFVFQVVDYYSDGFGLKKFLLFLICLGLVLFYFLMKKLIYGLIGFVNEGTLEFSEIRFNLANYYRILGLLLFPFVALIGYFPVINPQYLIIAGVILMVIFYWLFLLRSGKILLKNRFPIHYLFLYLCTLEILPLVLIGKLVLE